MGLVVGTWIHIAKVCIFADVETQNLADVETQNLASLQKKRCVSTKKNRFEINSKIPRNEFIEPALI